MAFYFEMYALIIGFHKFSSDISIGKDNTFNLNLQFMSWLSLFILSHAYDEFLNVCE